jgi:hypothetical protein
MPAVMSSERFFWSVEQCRGSVNDASIRRFLMRYRTLGGRQADRVQSGPKHHHAHLISIPIMRTAFHATQVVAEQVVADLNRRAGALVDTDNTHTCHIPAYTRSLHAGSQSLSLSCAPCRRWQI